MMLENAVIYVYPEKNIFNGTLFYSYEYYCFLKKILDIKFYIVYENNNTLDKNFLESLFKLKYKNNYDFEIIHKNKLLFKKFDKVIMLGCYSYNNSIISARKIFLFKNDNSINKKILNNVNVYGYYDYQKPFSYKDELMFYFDNFTDRITSSKRTLVTGTFPDNYKLNDNNINKKFNFVELDIFNKIDSIIYNYYNLDRNNRIIVESFFYNIPITIQNMELSNDSVVDRYNRCLKTDISIFDISKSKLLKDFIDS